MKEEAVVLCPNCQSENTAQDRKLKGFAGLLLLLISLPIPAFKKTYYCFDCQENFQLKEKKF